MTAIRDAINAAVDPDRPLPGTAPQVNRKSRKLLKGAFQYARIHNFAIAIFILTITTVAAVAQTGSITGQVSDPVGAAVVNATVMATSSATGITRTATTTSAGVYNFAALPPAVYDLTVTATGFQVQTKKNVILNVAATLPMNFDVHFKLPRMRTIAGPSWAMRSTMAATVIRP